ncbi:hypothetical protein HDA40_001862 [Hamadaea flava]|uniref:Tetratricopeptide repeat protein n=1 Tax=Hamadaea flava TaxID=1742688 RepID=A0ABV8LT95_9ACTN|nr:hypothetical protein [Hamadaea flava]MCP2323355.1 hypothetical protein [Hamadaea flava]
MTVGGQKNVDYELELWARTLLVGSRMPSVAEKVRAFRILAHASPRSYQARLARALVELSWDGRDRSPHARLALLEEAASAARGVPQGEPGRAELVIDVLDSYQITLYEVGRRAEGLAVREEMAAVSRMAVTAGAGPMVKGLRSLAHGFAEEQRHREAAELLAEVVDATPTKDVGGTSIWDRLSLCAELDAGGQTNAAVTALGDILDEHRAGLLDDKTSVSNVFHILVWYTVLLDRASRPHDADRARREALGLARRLAKNGEPKNWSGAQYTMAGILLAVQAQDAEPAAPGQPRPAFGLDMAYWSRDLRTRYVQDTGAARCGVAATDRPGTLLQTAQRETRLPEIAVLRRRLAIRTAAYWLWHHGYRFLEPTLPAFNDSVTAARMWHSTDAPRRRPALARALTDRAMLLITGHHYTEALTDYEEALYLMGTK